MTNRWGNSGNNDKIYLFIYLFILAPKSLQMLLQVTKTMKLKMFAPWEKSYGQPRQYMKKQRHYFDNKGQSSQSYGFSSSHIWM